MRGLLQCPQISAGYLAFRKNLHIPCIPIFRVRKTDSFSTSGQSSKKLLDRHLSKGKLIICEVVFAELAARFLSEEELQSFLADTGMGLVHSEEESLYTAGTRWAEYARKGAKNRFSCVKCRHVFEVTCPKCTADCILSRDLGVYKAYFSDLKVVGSI